MTCNPSTTLPKGWGRRSLNDYFIAFHPSLPVHVVRDVTKTEVGFVLGWPIERDSLQTEIDLPFVASLANAKLFEGYIDQLGGRYVILLLAKDCERLYLDAGGTLGVVYNPSRNTAGSTVTALVCHDPEHPIFAKPLGGFPDNRPNQFYPAGTTVTPEIRRLLPNHYLDLKSWKPVRHYPINGLPPIDESNVELVAAHLVQNIEAVVDHMPRVYMPLTAGRDSRTLLACARQWLNKLHFVTFDYSPWRNERSDKVDLVAAKSIARRLNLKHQIIPVRDVSKEAALDYLQRIGFAGGAGKSRDFHASCRDHLSMNAAWITGFNGGVGKCFYGRAGDRDGDSMTPLDLVRRMNLPEHFEGALRGWMRGLPEMPLSTMLDLAYLEHRCGCWAGPHIYGAAPFSIVMTPFNHRMIYDTMLRLPLEYRRNKLLFRDIVRRTMPGLEALPFNEYPDLRRVFGPQSAYGRSKRKLKSNLKDLLAW